MEIPGRIRREALCPCCAGLGKIEIPTVVAWPLDSVKEVPSDGVSLVLCRAIEIDRSNKEDDEDDEGVGIFLSVLLRQKDVPCSSPVIEDLPVNPRYIQPRFQKITRQIAAAGSVMEPESIRANTTAQSTTVSSATDKEPTLLRTKP